MSNITRLAEKAVLMAKNRAQNQSELNSEEIKESSQSSIEDPQIEEYFLNVFRNEFVRIWNKNAEMLFFELIGISILDTSEYVTIKQGRAKHPEFNLMVKRELSNILIWLETELANQNTLKKVFIDKIVHNLINNLKSIISIPKEKVEKLLGIWYDKIQISKKDLEYELIELINDEINSKIPTFKFYYALLYELMDSNVKVELDNNIYPISHFDHLLPKSLEYNESINLYNVMEFLTPFRLLISYIKYRNIVIKISGAARINLLIIQDYDFCEYAYEKLILTGIHRGLSTDIISEERQVELLSKFYEIITHPKYHNLQYKAPYLNLINLINTAVSTNNNERGIQEVTYNQINTKNNDDHLAIDKWKSEIKSVELSIVKIGDMFVKKQIETEKYMKLYEEYQKKLEFSKLQLEKLLHENIK